MRIRDQALNSLEIGLSQDTPTDLSQVWRKELGSLSAREVEIARTVALASADYLIFHLILGIQGEDPNLYLFDESSSLIASLEEALGDEMHGDFIAGEDGWRQRFSNRPILEYGPGEYELPDFNDLSWLNEPEP